MTMLVSVVFATASQANWTKAAAGFVKDYGAYREGSADDFHYDSLDGFLRSWAYSQENAHLIQGARDLFERAFGIVDQRLGEFAPDLRDYVDGKLVEIELDRTMSACVDVASGIKWDDVRQRCEFAIFVDNSESCRDEEGTSADWVGLFDAVREACSQYSVKTTPKAYLFGDAVRPFTAASLSPAEKTHQLDCGDKYTRILNLFESFESLRSTEDEASRLFNGDESIKIALVVSDGFWSESPDRELVRPTSLVLSSARRKLADIRVNYERDGKLLIVLPLLGVPRRSRGDDVANYRLDFWQEVSRFPTRLDVCQYPLLVASRGQGENRRAVSAILADVFDLLCLGSAQARCCLISGDSLVFPVRLSRGQSGLKIGDPGIDRIFRIREKSRTSYDVVATTRPLTESLDVDTDGTVTATMLVSSDSRAAPSTAKITLEFRRDRTVPRRLWPGLVGGSTRLRYAPAGKYSDACAVVSDPFSSEYHTVPVTIDGAARSAAEFALPGCVSQPIKYAIARVFLFAGAPTPGGYFLLVNTGVFAVPDFCAGLLIPLLAGVIMLFLLWRRGQGHNTRYHRSIEKTLVVLVVIFTASFPRGFEPRTMVFGAVIVILGWATHYVHARPLPSRFATWILAGWTWLGHLSNPPAVVNETRCRACFRKLWLWFGGSVGVLYIILAVFSLLPAWSIARLLGNQILFWPAILVLIFMTPAQD